MKRAALIFASAIILIANGLALLHVARNRAGKPSAEITLTNRELQYFAHPSRDDDSGVTLALQWMDPNSLWRPAGTPAAPRWLDRQKLKTLGFDCSLNPESTGAVTFYRRQRPRQAFVALEYDGPAWKTWGEAYQRSTTQAQPSAQPRILDGFWGMHSHLVAIDADLDCDKLRARHPDRHSVLIQQAAIAISLDPFPLPIPGGVPQLPPQIVGNIPRVNYSISVPRPFSDEFRRKHATSGAGEETDVVVYRVRLSYGSELEPWITGVEFTDKH